MTQRRYALYVCGCDGKLWMHEHLGMDCWLCKSEVQKATAEIIDIDRADEPAGVFDPARGKLL